MLHEPPPRALPRTPTKAVLTAGTLLYRVHSGRRQGTALKATPTHCLYGGGRFDATPCDDYPFLYAGLSAESAVCETLLRSIPFNRTRRARTVPRVAVRGRCLSFLHLAREVTLVSLVSGRDLSAVAQDAWLVQAEAADYPYTRDWGHWIRARTEPWAQGLVWPAKRDPGQRALVLFGDRCPPGVLAQSDTPPIDFDTAEGERWLNEVLEPYHARVPPRSRGGSRP